MASSHRRRLAWTAVCLTLSACTTQAPGQSIAPIPTPVAGSASPATASLGSGYVRPGAVDENKRSITLTLVTGDQAPAAIRWVDKEGRGALTTDSSAGTTWRVVVDGDYLETITATWRDANGRIYDVSTTLEISKSLIKTSSQRPILSVSPSRLRLIAPPVAGLRDRIDPSGVLFNGRAEVRLFRVETGEDLSASLPLTWSAGSPALQAQAAPDNRSARIVPQADASSDTVTVRLTEFPDLVATIPVDVRPLAADILPVKPAILLAPGSSDRPTVKVIYRNPWDGSEILTDTASKDLRFSTQDSDRLKVDADGTITWIGPPGTKPAVVTVDAPNSLGASGVIQVYGDDAAWQDRLRNPAKAATIEGVVTDANLKLLPGATVDAVFPDGRTVTVTADGVGRYRLPGATIGDEVRLTVRKTDHVSQSRRLVVAFEREVADFTGGSSLTYVGVAVPLVTPSPTPGPSPSPGVTPTPSPLPGTTPTPTPTPSSSPSAGMTITTAIGTGDAGAALDGEQALQTRLRGPFGVAVAPDGAIVFSDTLNHVIRRMAPNGTVTTIAGNGTFGFDGDGGSATQATLGVPYDVAVDSQGNVFFTDPYHRRVRRISANGIITTVAGTGNYGDSGLGSAGTAADLKAPYGITVDKSGNVYFTDAGTCRLLKLDTGGVLTAIAGTGSPGFSGDGSPATGASLNLPQGVTVDGNGVLYVADWENQRIRRISATGTITTVAGIGSRGFSGDGGPATVAHLNGPYGLAVDANNQVYVSDWDNQRIRRVGTDGTITTVAGTGAAGTTGDTGPALSALLNGPAGLAIASDGSLLVADYYNNRIRRLRPTP
jgi:sugar lactone lactonase YvrE